MKKCSSCQTIKDLKDFYANNSREDGLATYCKNCNKLWVRRRYKNNRDYYDKKNKETRKRNKKHLFDYLVSHPCVDCGESDPVVLEFDHLKNKKECISIAANKNWSLKSLNDEIEKCEVRCANCHRRKTMKNSKNYKIQLLEGTQTGKAG